MARWMNNALVAFTLGGLFLGACGGSSTTVGSGDGDGDSGNGDGDSSTTRGDGDGDSGDGDSGNGDGDSGDGDSGSGDGDSGDGDEGTTRGGAMTTTTSDGRTLIGVTQIRGGGANSAPLAAGCGPETAQECTAPGGGCDNKELIDGGQVRVKDAGATCFFGEGIEDPSATVEYITEAVEGEEYVHLRVIFDPNFVDTVYGECSGETGWNSKRGHTFNDLLKSDHVELMLYNCDDDLSMHMKVDFLAAEASTDCGYATAGVSGGDGSITVGSADDVLAVGTSLDRNMNGCGYCELEHSPCPGGDNYEPSVDAPEWDFRMVYELWIDADAFGDSGFCRPDIEYVHASPAKASTDTINVEPDDCPPPPGGDGDGDSGDGDSGSGSGGGGDCPPNYELYLASEGEFLCAGPPQDGDCPVGYEIDLTSEGELCIPLGEQ